MEKCLKPNGACSFILPTMETRCAQVHSIHRLLVFEKGKGFFIDSFKIPTGCTCQVIKSGTGHSRFSSSGHHLHSSDQTSNNQHSAHGHKGVHTSKGHPQNHGQSSSGHNIADTQAAFVSSYDTRFNIGPKYQTGTHTDGSTSSSNKYFSGSAPLVPSGHQEEEVQWFPPTSSFSPGAFPHSSGSNNSSSFPSFSFPSSFYSTSSSNAFPSSENAIPSSSLTSSPFLSLLLTFFFPLSLPSSYIFLPLHGSKEKKKGDAYLHQRKTSGTKTMVTTTGTVTVMVIVARIEKKIEDNNIRTMGRII